jgi:iron complex transport system substrate-binding protein
MKILSLQPSVSLILESLGRLDALIGCTRYCLDVVPALREREIAIVRDSWSSETAEISDLHPDLVIASVPYRMESLAAILKAGLPVLALAPHSLADIYADIRLIGSVAGESAKANEVASAMQAAIADVAGAAARSAHRPLVYCEEWGKPLIHSQLWVKELVEAAGGVFLGEPGKLAAATTIESADPEVIVLAWCGAGGRVPVERVAAMRGWQELHAVRAGRMVCIRDELLNTPAPTLVEGLRALAGVIHPELFGAAPTGKV